MSRRIFGRTGLCLIGAFFLAVFCVWNYIGTRDFIQAVGEEVSEQATQSLATKVEIEGVRIVSPFSVKAEKLRIFDKQGKLLARAEAAILRFSLFDILQGKTTGAVERVTLQRLEAYLAQDSNGRWNYQDLIKEDEEKSAFAGEVCLEDGSVRLSLAGKELQLTELNGTADCADMDAIGLDGSTRVDGAPVRVKGRLGEAMQLQVELAEVQVERYLSWLPAGMIPEGVVIHSGRIDEAELLLSKRAGSYAYSGSAVISEGRLAVANTEIEKLQGKLKLQEKQELQLELSAEAAEQPASVKGRVVLGEKDTLLKLQVSSTGFDPARILKDIPYSGAVAVEAEVFGTVTNPTVEARLRIKKGEACGIAFSDAKAEAVYADGLVTVHSLTADTLGGSISLGGELLAKDLYYDGHVVLKELDLSELAEYLPAVTGRLTADLGFKGQGDDVTQLSLYGDVKLKKGSYQGVGIPSMQGSFYQNGQDLVLDYVSMQLENNGELGMEGTIRNGRELDLSYIASHIDLSLVQNFVPEADMVGFGDVEGTIKGDSSNPVVRGKVAALRGALFKQPFRTLHGEFGGNLMGVRIKDFEMETDGNVNWMIKGDIGFLGDRYVDLQIDTIGARMEDIAALVAPNQPVTGVVDNIITIKGTMADPDIVGYIHLYRGSYNGYLLQGMDGDYTVKNGVATLNDFHIFSPLVDMVLNGAVNVKTQAIDLRVAAKDFDVTRFGSKLPYPISGHGTFYGQASGTISAPVFEGELKAGTLDFNGVQITDGYGRVRYSNGRIMMMPFSFNQNGGSYVLNLTSDVNTKGLEGRIEIQKGDINAILTVLNSRRDFITGQLDGVITLSGTVDNPRANIYGLVERAKVGSYELNGLLLDASYANRRLQLKQLEGEQDGGKIKAVGFVDLDGDVQGTLSVDNVQAGIIPAAFGFELNTRGRLSLEAQLAGTFERPEAVASFTVANGGVAGSAFDELSGMLDIHDGIINLEQLVVKKDQAGKRYSVSAHGNVPLAALNERAEQVAGSDRMNLVVTLDEGDLSMLPVLWNEIDWGMGDTYGKIVIGGTLNAPTFDGMLGLTNGAVKLKQNRIPVTEMNVKLVGSGTHIALEECSGRLGAGRYTLTGQTDLLGVLPVNYNVKLEANSLEFDLPFYKGPLTMEAAVFEDSFYGKRLPKVQTNILIQNALISVPSIPEDKTELPDVIMDVNLEIGKRVHFYCPALADFWFSGKVHYGGTMKFITPSGSIHVDHGKLSYLGTSFRIREGTATFNQVDSFLPSLDFMAEARLNRTKVFLNISGPAEAWNMKLSSVPAMSEADIIKMLTLRSDVKSGQNSEDQLNDLLLAGLQMAFMGEVEGAMRDLLKLDEFTIKRDAEFTHGNITGSANKDAYDVQIGKYINDKVLLEYTHGINSDRRRVGMRYEFDDRFSMSVGHDNDSKLWFGLEARIPF